MLLPSTVCDYRGIICSRNPDIDCASTFNLCGFWFTNPGPKEDQITRLYPEDYGPHVFKMFDEQFQHVESAHEYAPQDYTRPSCGGSARGWQRRGPSDPSVGKNDSLAHACRT